MKNCGLRVEGLEKELGELKRVEEALPEGDGSGFILEALGEITN